jgi:hypothetical protein
MSHPFIEVKPSRNILVFPLGRHVEIHASYPGGIVIKHGLVSSHRHSVVQQYLVLSIMYTNRTRSICLFTSDSAELANLDSHRSVEAVPTVSYRTSVYDTRYPLIDPVFIVGRVDAEWWPANQFSRLHGALTPPLTSRVTRRLVLVVK